MSKDEDKELCSGKFNFTLDELIKLYKEFPNMIASYYLSRVWIALTIGLLGCIFTDGGFKFIYVVISCVVYYFYLKLNVKRQIEKILFVMKDESYEFSIFENYLLVKGNFRENKYFYGYFDKVVETDTNFYFYNTKFNRLIIFIKDELNSTVIKLFRDKIDKLEDRKKGSKFSEELKVKKTKKLLDILFFLTVSSLFIVMGILVYICNELGIPNIFQMRYMWLFWCFLPITISTTVLGIKHRNSGIKTTKYIIFGIIFSILLLIYGSFSFMFDKQDQVDISFYEEILNIDVKDKNSYYISIYDDELSYCDNCFDLAINFIDKNIVDVKNEHWLTYDQINDKFKNNFIYTPYYETAYYMVYDKTTGDYNEYPKSLATHELYYISYSPKINFLEVKMREFSHINNE